MFWSITTPNVPIYANKTKKITELSVTWENNNEWVKEIEGTEREKKECSKGKYATFHWCLTFIPVHKRNLF